MSKNISEDVDVTLENDTSVDISEEQNSFLESSLGQIINNSVDTGLRAILPDIVENEIIDIKDTLINEGFSEAINKVINSAIDIGKSAIGVITGNFENVSQAEKAVESGGIIDGVSDALDFVLDKVSDFGLLSTDITEAIKSGKDTLLKNVSSNIKKEFKTQTKNIENLSTYNESWKEAFNNQDFEQMEKYMKKINKTLAKTLPMENTINDARTIENLHELIKNNNGSFELTDEQLELANLLK